MMIPMSRVPSPIRRAVAPLVTVLVLLVALSPTLLFGESSSALGLLFLAAGLLGGGLVLSRVGGADVRSIGKLLAIVGAVLLIVSLGLLALLLGGWGRPY